MAGSSLLVDSLTYHMQIYQVYSCGFFHFVVATVICARQVDKVLVPVFMC